MFTCFTSTQVQILYAYKFTCCTSTQVQILTPALSRPLRHVYLLYLLYLVCLLYLVYLHDFRLGTWVCFLVKQVCARRDVVLCCCCQQRLHLQSSGLELLVCEALSY